MLFLRDVRQAARQLLHSPGYTAAAVVTFALVIGANSAIFSAVRAVLLAPLPVAQPGRLAVVWQTDEGGQAVIELTYRHLREWMSAGHTFTSAAVFGSHNWSGVLQQPGAEPSRIWFCGVSGTFFETLGVQPLLGRSFVPEDDVPNAAPVAVLSHDAWTRRFAANASVIGTTMQVDGSPIRIVGVMPPGMEFPRGAEFWIPVVPFLASGTPPDTAALDTVGVFYVLGRTRGDLAPAALRTELDGIEQQLDRATPGRLKWGAHVVARPFLDHVFGPVRPALKALWVAVGVLLLIGCANVSGLLLTRLSRRAQDQAIRLALGASRGAVARLWTLEVVLLAGAGGIAGLIAARWLAGLVVRLAPDDLPRLGAIAVDARVALFTLVLVAVAAIATTILPMRQATRTSPLLAIETTRTTTSAAALRARALLLVGQVALSVILLIAAGLVLRSLLMLRQTDLGFRPDRVLSLTVQPRGTTRPGNDWMRDFLAEVRQVPGVEAAGAVLLRPLLLGPIGQGVSVILEGQPETRAAAESNPILNYQVATPGYFEALRIPLRTGRRFTGTDAATAPRVAVVSESTARRLWPGQDPIGRRLSMSTFTPGKRGREWRTVVGVVADVHYRGVGEAQLDVYDPAAQAALTADNVLVRTSGEPLQLAGAVRAIARRLDPESVVDAITPMDAVVERAEAPWRLSSWMFVLFAGLAFALAAVGLFSLVALDVSMRQREFAIRLALGETGRGLLARVLKRTAVLVTVGLGAGIFVAWSGSRAIRGLLFGVAPDDPLTYAAVIAIVFGAIVTAAWLPARRATKVNPSAVLRGA